MTNVNPLFPTADTGQDNRDPGGYVLPTRHHTVQPIDRSGNGTNEAVDLIRAKLERIYAEAPDPFEESEKVAESAPPLSKHQQYMAELSASGKSLADIQTAWNEYYANLPDDEKHQVWQEFYTANPEKPKLAADTTMPKQIIVPRPQYMHKPSLSYSYAHPRPIASPPDSHASVIVSAPMRSLPQGDKQAIANVRDSIQQKVTMSGQLQAKDHLHSLFFGLGVGVVTLVIFLFGFFNEVIVAPFIQPSRNVGATPIIVNAGDVTPTSSPEVIIPKIHLEIPVDYSQTSTKESDIETALENGVVHYPSTVMPGQKGNAAFFGHSSNNIFNPGKYKFAFVLLHELQTDDTFYLTYSGKVYVYKVFEKKIVEPDEVDVLNNIPGHAATATLITCDPPGTSLHRLVVIADQISPDPSGEPGGSNTSMSLTATSGLPGNGPSLLSRIWHSIF